MYFLSLCTTTELISGDLVYVLSLKNHEARNSRTAETGKKEEGMAVCLVMAGKHHMLTAAARNRTRRGLALCLPLPGDGTAA